MSAATAPTDRALFFCHRKYTQRIWLEPGRAIPAPSNPYPKLAAEKQRAAPKLLHCLRPAHGSNPVAAFMLSMSMSMPPPQQAGFAMETTSIIIER